MVFVLLAATAITGCRFGGDQVYRNTQIGWQIGIEEGCKRLSPEEIEDIRDQGEILLGRAAEDGRVRTRVEPLLWCRLDKQNMFTSNLVSLEEISRQQYLEDYHTVHKLIEVVLESQGVPYQIQSAQQTIDGKTFSTFMLTLYDKNKQPVATQKQYRRFFGEQELSVTLSYSDPDKGKRLQAMWHGSKFTVPE